jgi:hypothetical protein
VKKKRRRRSLKQAIHRVFDEHEFTPSFIYVYTGKQTLYSAKHNIKTISSLPTQKTNTTIHQQTKPPLLLSPPHPLTHPLTHPPT